MTAVANSQSRAIGLHPDGCTGNCDGKGSSAFGALSGWESNPRATVRSCKSAFPPTRQVPVQILVTSIPSVGHIHPLVPLALALQREGHEVVWATGPDACERVERYGFHAMSAGASTAERTSARARRAIDLAALPPRERRQAFVGAMWGATAARMQKDLAPIVDDLHPDLLLHDTAEFAAAPVASARGIPHITVAFSGALSEPLIKGIVDETATVWRAEGLDVPADAGLYEHLYLHPFPRCMGPAPTAATVRPMRPLGFDGGFADQSPREGSVERSR